MQIGIQLYTLRDETSKDFVGTLRKVAAEGFQGVEFAGYGGMEASKLLELLNELGLKAIGSHVGFGRLKEALDAEIAFNKAIGSTYIVCPYMGESDRGERWPETFRQLEEIGRKCAEQGVTFCYHNHAFELEEKIGDETSLDAMFRSVPADALQVELDACWVHFAGYDPVAYIDKYKGKLPLVHFKDVSRTAEGKPLTVELGQGEVNLPAIAEAAGKAGVEWLIYEQDFTQNPPLVAMANSMRWLKEIGLA